VKGGGEEEEMRQTDMYVTVPTHVEAADVLPWSRLEVPKSAILTTPCVINGGGETYKSRVSREERKKKTKPDC
jgi:hypothetical protein